MNKKIAFILTTSISAFLALSVFIIAPIIIKWNDTQRLYYSGEIIILKNEDFNQKYDFKGTGTIDDPFIIENLIINTSKKYCILIQDTTRHFIIRNCSLTATLNPIYINNAGYKTATIENNFCKIIYLIMYWYYYSYHSGCITVISTDNVLIKNNYCEANFNFVNGLSLISSKNSIVDNNICAENLNGIYLDSSTNISVINNYCCFNIENGIGCEQSENIFILNNICEKNYYSGIFCEENSNVTVSNNLCRNNTVGIHFYYNHYFIPSSHLIFSNIILNNSLGGIYFGYNYNTIIFANTIIGQEIGFKLYNSRNIQIYYNDIKFNLKYGISCIGSENITIYNNNFQSNNLNGTETGLAQAYDSSELNSDNFWYNQTLNKGNWWSDLIWNEGIIYEVDGSGFIDQYPLQNPIDLSLVTNFMKFND